VFKADETLLETLMDELSKIVQSYQDLSHKQSQSLKESQTLSQTAFFLAESLSYSTAESKGAYIKLSLEAAQGRAKASQDEMAQSESLKRYADEKDVKGRMQIDFAVLQQLAKTVELSNAALTRETTLATDLLVSNAKRILGSSSQFESISQVIEKNKKREQVAKESSKRHLLDVSTTTTTMSLLRAEGNDMVKRAIEIEAKSSTAESALAGLKADCLVAEKAMIATKADEASSTAAVSSYIAALASSNQQIQALELRKHQRNVEKRNR
jgi:hypothetical protein